MHRITIEPARISGDRGQRYRVHFQGAVLIEDCWNPELDACRALVVRGLAGRLEVWRAGTTYPGLIIPDIGAAAFRTVKESEKNGPSIWSMDASPGGSRLGCNFPLTCIRASGSFAGGWGDPTRMKSSPQQTPRYSARTAGSNRSRYPYGRRLCRPKFGPIPSLHRRPTSCGL